MGDKRQEGEGYDVPCSRQGVFGASRPPSPETTACTMEAVQPLAQAVIAHFISAYHLSLSGAQAIWANQKYHGHHVLPPDMVAFVKKMVPQ